MAQTNKQTEILGFIKKLKEKEANFYFFTLDTRGNPVASVANIYEHVKVLGELGYKAHILHEKNDYKLNGDESGMGLVDWLGEEYGKLSHISIEAQTLSVSPTDFIIIPEIFSNVMEQVKQFPCKKVVFSQSPEYILELLPIGRRWNMDYGFHDVITTSKKQADFVKTLFPSINTHVIPVSIPSYFKPSDKPKIPLVTIVSRNQGDATKIVKMFYLQNPIYKWVSFKELRGLNKQDFARELGKSCLAVWLDDLSGFGTFPLEAIECETPVIGKIPNMVPEWMETIDSDGNPTLKNNGVWTNTTHNIPELIATYIKVWMEDSVPQELLDNINDSKGGYSELAQRDKIETVYNQLIQNRIGEFEALVEVTAPVADNTEVK